MPNLSLRPRAVVAALALALPLGLAACGSSGGEQNTGSGSGSTAAGGIQTVSPGKLTVCTHLSYPPFQFNKDGKVVGFDVDVVDRAAKSMGLTQDVVDIDFEQITTGAVFKAKKCDVAAAGMTITDERKKAVLFSEPYFDATQALIVKKGAGVTDLAALKGKKLGVQTGTTGQEYAKKNASAGFSAVVFEDLPTSLNALKAGRVDATINDNGVLFDFAKQNPDTEVVAEFATGEQYGVAAKKDDPNAQQIITKINESIATSKQDGSYDETYKKWFGTAPGEKSTAAPSSSAG
ncbi:ABC transporter substrate-binding protein [Agilicoccus flavus]|uniref:ABC transporter substrate-binding protein n=1 Tax=Agilicoccus flavus TaxID=2775968 RepID=UPI001CF65521|nr:ABC transporter substrate-binding protein [Agilicoccus flavus]